METNHCANGQLVHVRSVSVGFIHNGEAMHQWSGYVSSTSEISSSFSSFKFKFQVSSFICHIHDYTETV